jgi:hypothetical protein
MHPSKDSIDLLSVPSGGAGSDRDEGWVGEHGRQCDIRPRHGSGKAAPAKPAAGAQVAEDEGNVVASDTGLIGPQQAAVRPLRPDLRTPPPGSSLPNGARLDSLVGR